MHHRSIAKTTAVSTNCVNDRPTNENNLVIHGRILMYTFIYVLRKDTSHSKISSLVIVRDADSTADTEIFLPVSAHCWLAPVIQRHNNALRANFEFTNQ